MIAKEFEFHRPTEISEALALLGQAGGEVKVLAGGMSLVPAMNLGIVQPDAIVSLNHVQMLDAFVDDGERLSFGALVRHRRVETDAGIRAACPLLSEAAALIADVQIRHRGTIGGSIAHADPAANYVPVMVALDARFRLASYGGERWVDARHFFQGLMQTSLEPSEILIEIVIPRRLAGRGFAYCRHARIDGNFAIANAAAIVDENARARIVVGATTAKPIVVEDRIPEGPTFVRFVDRIGDAVHAACTEPLEDLNGTAVYRRSMARVVARRAVTEALRRREAFRGRT